MALSSANSLPEDAILQLVRDQYNGEISVVLDDAEYGDYDPVTDERPLVKPATVLIDHRSAWTKLDNSPRASGNSYSWDVQWGLKSQFDIQPGDPYIPKGAILVIHSHSHDPQLIGQTGQVVGTEMQSLINIRKVYATAEMTEASSV